VAFCGFLWLFEFQHYRGEKFTLVPHWYNLRVGRGITFRGTCDWTCDWSCNLRGDLMTYDQKQIEMENQRIEILLLLFYWLLCLYFSFMSRAWSNVQALGRLSPNHWSSTLASFLQVSQCMNSFVLSRRKQMDCFVSSSIKK